MSIVLIVIISISFFMNIDSFLFYEYLITFLSFMIIIIVAGRRIRALGPKGLPFRSVSWTMIRQPTNLTVLPPT